MRDGEKSGTSKHLLERLLRFRILWRASNLIHMYSFHTTFAPMGINHILAAKIQIICNKMKKQTDLPFTYS